MGDQVLKNINFQYSPARVVSGGWTLLSSAVLLVLLLLAIATFALVFPLQRGKAMDEDVTSESQAMQANGQAALASQGRRCEMREMNVDEGYGVTRKEMRRVCR